MLLLLRTSIRVAEACSLRLSDKRWNHGRWVLRVKVKGRSERTIPLPDDGREAIDEYLKLDRGRKGQLSAQRFGRALTLLRSDVEMLRGRKAGRPKKGRSAIPVNGSRRRKLYSKSLDEIIAESKVTPWTDADFERAAEIGEGPFDGFAEQVRRWRDQNEASEAERWARLRL